MGSGEVGRKRNHSRVSGGLEPVLLAQVWGESGHRALGYDASLALGSRVSRCSERGSGPKEEGRIGQLAWRESSVPAWPPNHPGPKHVGERRDHVLERRKGYLSIGSTSRSWAIPSLWP